MDDSELDGALRDRRESGAVRRRHAPRAARSREARSSRRAGDLPDEDGADGARRVSGGGDVGRGRRARSRTASAACSACRKAVEPPGEARDEIWIMSELARRMGRRLGSSHRRRRVERGARALAAARRHELRAPRGARTACSGRVPTRSHPGTKFLHARLWDEDPAKRGRLAPFSVVHHERSGRAAGR